MMTMLPLKEVLLRKGESRMSMATRPKSTKKLVIRNTRTMKTTSREETHISLMKRGFPGRMPNTTT